MYDFFVAFCIGYACTRIMLDLAHLTFHLLWR